MLGEAVDVLNGFGFCRFEVAILLVELFRVGGVGFVVAKHGELVVYLIRRFVYLVDSMQTGIDLCVCFLGGEFYLFRFSYPSLSAFCAGLSFCSATISSISCNRRRLSRYNFSRVASSLCICACLVCCNIFIVYAIKLVCVFFGLEYKAPILGKTAIIAATRLCTVFE